MTRFAVAALPFFCILFCACATTPGQQDSDLSTVAKQGPEYIDPALLQQLQDAASKWHAETRLERLGVDVGGGRQVPVRIDRIDLLRIELVGAERFANLSLESFDARFVFGTESRAQRCIALRVGTAGQVERVGEVALERDAPPVARTSHGSAAELRIPTPQQVIAAALRLASRKQVESIELRWETTGAVFMSTVRGAGWFGWRVCTDTRTDSGFVLPADLGRAGATFG